MKKKRYQDYIKGLAKNQHFVPRFVLERFCVEKSQQIYVFDKHEEKIFKTNIRNIASEKGFYNFDVAGNKYTIEPGLANLEGTASDIIKSIIQNESIGQLKEEDRESLTTFLAVQYARVKAKRIDLAKMNHALEDRLREMGTGESEIDQFKIGGEDQVRRESIKFLMDSVGFVPYILDKVWLLYKYPRRTFYISDNPVVLNNRNNYSPYGNLGFAVKGIEIYFPISKSLTLAMLCPSYGTLIRNQHDQCRKLLKLNPAMSAEIIQGASQIEELFESMKTGHAVSCDMQNVIYCNSLQVMNSPRYVYSSDDDFGLVKQMLADNPNYKHGLTIKIRKERGKKIFARKL